MQIYLAADHAGFALKDRLKAHLIKQGHKIVDLTPVFKDGDDYPLVAKKLTTDNKGRLGRLGRSGRGLLLCGSGIGVCIAANRVKGIRAAVGHTPEEVKLAREHDDINVLCLSGWNHKDKVKAIKMVNVFLKTKRSPASRHVRRVKQLG
ncbi:MAG: RpiB/LacA/LacB family sugar-phosphate isomerase [Patescibacteria group bacterium]|jgi:RpiB/LacA/LacB family sugar-phosphate isomerase